MVDTFLKVHVKWKQTLNFWHLSNTGKSIPISQDKINHMALNYNLFVYFITINHASIYISFN